MQSALFSLLLTVAVALTGLFGVPKPFEELALLSFFSLLVVFVVLMVLYLARDR